MVMSELVPFGETTGYNYEQDRLVVDVVLLNRRVDILAAVDTERRLPIGDEIFDPSIHDYESASDKMNPQSRKTGLLAHGLLRDRFTELTGGSPAIWLSQRGQAQAMLERVKQEWVDRYLLTHAERVGPSVYAEWLATATRHQPNLETFDESMCWPVFRAFTDMAIGVHATANNGWSEYKWLPSILVVPPGITATAVPESKCYVAEWDAIGSDQPLRAPKNPMIEDCVREQLGLDQTRENLAQRLAALA